MKGQTWNSGRCSTSFNVAVYHVIISTGGLDFRPGKPQAFRKLGEPVDALVRDYTASKFLFDCGEVKKFGV
jgi:hypothetical protein